MYVRLSWLLLSGIQISGSVKILVYPTCSLPELLMLVMGRYMLVVYSPGGRIKKNRPVKIFKMAVIQDGRQNYIELSENIPFLSLIASKISNVDIFIHSVYALK